MSLVTIDNVSKVYNPNTQYSVEAVRNLDIEIDDGEFVSVVGPTGCGKSTLLEMVAGLTEPTDGEIRLGGTAITEPSDEVAVVFQDDSALPWRTTMQNVEFGLEMRGVDKASRRERASEMIDLVGLSGFEDAHPPELSGGMRQRVAIARALALNPNIMLMDEPFGALDEQTRRILGDELLSICQETNQTTLFITHSLNEAVHLSDKVAVMTARPGEIKTLVDIDIPRPRTMDVIGSERFRELVDELWDPLREESYKGLDQENEQEAQ
ncbi:ATP-binding cassette domain-containing protein [Halobellus sp. GM3]|uniref:ATP-binding cassette domain-containing protein n=1 Tax=Halobellus sp. GM3 TaxID=3458410 RepID=UPI00403E27B0